jgi:hypothetical protein
MTAASTAAIPFRQVAFVIWEDGLFLINLIVFQDPARGKTLTIS